MPAWPFERLYRYPTAADVMQHKHRGKRAARLAVSVVALVTAE